MPAGILLTMGEQIFYHAGDTDVFSDMKLIGDLNNIDIAALPIGDNFTMGPDDATIAATWLKAKQYIPMHYDTFDLIKQDPVEWKNQMALKNLEVVVMSSGDVITTK